MVNGTHRLLKNAIMSVVQVIVIGVSLFFLYRFLLNILGPEQLGIWALVLGTTSVSEIANLGLSGSVVKFVAKYLAKNDSNNASNVIQTSIITASVSSLVILLAGYPLIRYILKLIINEDSLQVAYEILPFSLFALWFMSIMGIITSGFDGSHRIDIRNIILMCWTLFHLSLSFILAPKYGLIGLAYARLASNIILTIISWFLLRKYFKNLPFLPTKWNKNIFREIFGYSIKFQGSIVARMFYEPITKIFLTRFGGLQMVGFFEMANRMVTQLRALIVSANQAIIPAIADIKEKTPEKIKSFYRSSYQLLYFLSISLFSLIIIFIPIVSIIWIGHYNEVFVYFAVLLSIGWFINSLNATAYFVNIGTGELNLNLISSTTIAVLNTGFCYLLGLYFNGYGVVAGWMIALVTGSNIIFLLFLKRYNISFREIIPRECRILSSVFGSLVILMIIIQLSPISLKEDLVFNVLLAIVFFIPFLYFFWINPIRRYFFYLVKRELFIKKAK